MRFERKYRIDNLSIFHILQIIKVHPASFYKLHPDRFVNNIYFDTPNLTCLNDNLMGVNHRKKYRVRWYGADVHTIINPKLEVKYKENELGGKTVLDLEPISLSNLNDIQQKVNALIPQQHTLKPTLLNSYYRSYWGTKDGKFRITVDAQLQFHSLMHSPHFVNYVHKDAVVVVELKYDETDEKMLDEIVRFLPFRLSKNSKYVNGFMLTR